MTSVARRPYRNGVLKRERILQSASAVFAERGYAGSSVRVIAEQVGTSPAALIQHFGSKEGLLMAVLEDWREQTNQVNPHESTGLAYLRGLREVIAFNRDHRGLIELFITMAAEASDPTHPAHDFISRRYRRTLANLTNHLLEARAAGEIDDLSDAEIDIEVRTLVAVLDGVELQWLLDRTVDLVGIFDRYLEHSIIRWGGDAATLSTSAGRRATDPRDAGGSLR